MALQRSTHKPAPAAWEKPTRPKGKPFSATEVAGLRPGPVLYRLYGDGGLIIEVTPSGAKHWRWRYRRHQGGDTMVALGPYPEVSLADARARLADAKRTREHGGDPVAVKAKVRAERDATFESVARDWIATTGRGLRPTTVRQRETDLARNVFPTLGARPIGTITPMLARPTFDAIVARGKVHTAHRMLAHCASIAEHAIADGQIEHNPFRSLGRILPREQTKHHPGLTAPADVARLLQAIWSYAGAIEVQQVLRLAPMVFMRPGEIIRLRWEDVDVAASQVLSRKDVRKEKRDLIVPLAPSALAIIEGMRPITGLGPFVFGMRLGHNLMSENTLNMAIRRMGFGKDEQTAHGLRSTARTILDEQLRFPTDIIELQMGHTIPGHLGDTYNRSTKIEDRRVMMARWADYLDGLRVGNLVAFPTGKVA